MDPWYIEVLGVFTPRGGIAIHPFANYADPADPAMTALAASRLAAAFDRATGA